MSTKQQRRTAARKRKQAEAERLFKEKFPDFRVTLRFGAQIEPKFSHLSERGKQKFMEAAKTGFIIKR